MIESHMNSAEINPSKNLSFLWLEITEKCNLECVHCYADSNPRKELLGQMTTEDWFQVIQQSAQMGCEQIQFIGGEPTLHPDLSRLISFASSQGYSFIEVFTNSTHITDNLLRTFIKYKVQIASSFYSDDPKIHDAITKRQNSFNRTVNGIKSFISSGLTVRVGIIEMEENLGHAPRARKYLKGLGVTDIGVDLQRGIGRGSRNAYHPNPLEQLCGECWKGKLCVTPSGKTYPCVFSRFAEVGHVKEGLSNIIRSKVLKDFRVSLRDFLYEHSMNVCQPHYCHPTSSACGPTAKCAPADNPPIRCVPDLGPCQPEVRPCQPESRGVPYER